MLPVCVCLGVHLAWEDIGYLPLWLFPFETGSLTEPGAYQLARLAGQRAPEILLSLPSEHWGHRHACCHAWYLIWVQGIHSWI